ncbi:MAG: DNA polymerase I [Bacteroidales bacterium]|nr:DNA polymerase I [Bacteroidales bacterium]
MEKKLLLLDGMAIVYRAYYALNRNPRINSKGLNTSAVLGFTTTMYDLIRSQKPTHIGVAFDLQAPTFRHEKFEQYKANRDAMPEDIQLALPYIKEIIRGFEIPILTCEGYEADDVIGTLSKKAEKEGFEVLMVTPDKDFGQLVSPQISMYRFGRMGRPDEILGVNEIMEKFSVARCEQVIDILGLWGDASDNIPGIPGIGEKKAKQLVTEFGSIENMIANADKIANEKLRNLVKEHADQALFSKELATIETNAPIDFDPGELLMKTPNYVRLKELFDELEFRNFAKKFFTDYSVSDPESYVNLSNTTTKKAKAAKATNFDQPTLFDTPAATSPTPTPLPQTTTDTIYTYADNEEKREQLKNDLLKQERIGIYLLSADTNIEGIAFAYGEGMAAYMPLKDNDSWDLACQILQAENIAKAAYNTKELKHKLIATKAITIKGTIFDVQIAHYLLYSEARHTLDFIASNILNTDIYDLESLIGKSNSKNHQTDFETIDPSLLTHIACQRADIILRLQDSLSIEMQKTKVEKLFAEIEMPLVDVLLSMEREGVRIDTEYLKEYSAQLQNEKNEIEQQIYSYAEKTFNIGSPKQLGEVLFDHLKIVDKAPKTATKQYSTAEDVLQKMIDKHPIVPLILEYRSLSKLISTYLDAFPKLISGATNRLHTTFNQTVTATGRLSSNNPNLQNIPIRTERGREIRKAFVPRNDDYILLAADYSQIELRIIASLSHDRHMIEAFTNKYDIHTATAAKIYNIAMEQVTPELRRNAKSVNFGIIYGISAFGLSEQLGIPRKEAATLIDEYFLQYPDIKNYIESNIEFARQYGYAQTMLGRRRYLPDINSRNAGLKNFAERNSVNMPIQGTSADMIKIAMNNIYKAFEAKQLKSKMILQVHDELVFDVYKPEIDEVTTIVRNEMINALPLDIPIEVSTDMGDNWLEAH